MPGRQTVPPPLTCEILEDRLALAGWYSPHPFPVAKAAPKPVPAMTPVLQRGTLTIQGTAGADTIEVRPRNGKISVLGKSFAAGQVKRITIDAGAGNDAVFIGSKIRKPSTLYGGEGDDWLCGGGGNDLLVGGAGIDNLDGGLGTNSLFDETPVSADAPVDITQEILRLVNEERARKGLRDLVLDPQLQTAADLQAGNMAQLSITLGAPAALQHVLPGVAQPTLTSRLAYAGYSYRKAAENIAYGYSSAAAVVAAWLASSAHRINLLSADFIETGIAVRVNAQGLLFFCQVFGSPW